MNVAERQSNSAHDDIHDRETHEENLIATELHFHAPEQRPHKIRIKLCRFRATERPGGFAKD